MNTTVPRKSIYDKRARTVSNAKPPSSSYESKLVSL